jgi:putative ABC transport system ATP-binding protein
MNLSIAAGEYMAITGPTEGDKSTLRYMLGRLDSPTSGEVLFRNGDLGKSISLDTYRSRNVGFVFSCISSDADIARN